VLVAWLAGLVLLATLGGALVLNAVRASFGGSLNGSLPEDLWQSLVRTIDTGTVANDTQWPARIIALGITLSGIFLAGSLIGIIATAVDQRVQELRKGRSTVAETGHTLILGWSPRLPLIVSELVVANENVRKPAIVVLAHEDKTMMDEELRERVGSTKNTRVVCRTGSPWKPDDLELVNVRSAKSIIVLSGEEGDAGVVKTILAVKTLDPNFLRAHVVAELAHNDNARTVRAVTDGRVLTINSETVVAEVTAQACHQGGLASVFHELLDFDGDEIYICDAPDLVGHSYGESVLAFERSSLIGRLTADGVVELNPNANTVFEPGDQVIAIAEDDDKVVFGGFRDIPVPEPARPGDIAEPPIRVLIVGWSAFGPKVLKEIDEFLSPGSFIEVAVDVDLVDIREVEAISLDNASMHVHSTAAGPEDLLRLADAEPFDQIIVLGYRSGLTVAEADAQTLLTLLTLRKLWPPGGSHHVRIVAELLDQANLAIATTTGVDDFIVSDALTSLMIAQLSERAELQEVFDDLFDPEGAVVELRSANALVPEGEVAFGTAVAAAIAQGASAIGYSLASSPRVVVNPPKSELIEFGPDDQILVVGLRAT
jgi:voltage-gated potassium channel Kch